MKMTFRIISQIFFILILISFIPKDSIAQSLEFLSTKKITNNKRIIPYKKSRDLFVNVPESIPYFDKSRKQLKTASIFGGLALGSIVFGVSIIAIDQHQGYCDLICLTDGQVIGLSAIVFGYPTLGIAYLVTHRLGKKNMKRAIDIYNKSFNKSTSNLSIGISEHGVGLIFNF